MLAVANLWLAARAEGLGVGWVSFFAGRELANELGLPGGLDVNAYLRVGYVDEFGPEPELRNSRLGASGGRCRGRCTPRSSAARGLPEPKATEDVFADVIAAVSPPAAAAMAAAQERQDMGRHLERFGEKDELEVEWVRA